MNLDDLNLMAEHIKTVKGVFVGFYRKSRNSCAAQLEAFHEGMPAPNATRDYMEAYSRFLYQTAEEWKSKQSN